MIHVSQGHENGIGVEAFLKSCLFFNPFFLKNITLHSSKEILETVSSCSKLNITFSDDMILYQNIKIQYKKIEDQDSSLKSLKSAINSAPKILITLPTSKDKFNGQLGYTEFFRDFFNLPYLGMNFISDHFNFLLLSDHHPLKEAGQHYNLTEIRTKITESIQSLKQFNRNIKRVFICGPNPHASEQGLIGHEETTVTLNQIDGIKLIYPVSADSLFLKFKIEVSDLIVFSHHDQALVLFKYINQFLGLHFTSGLPFMRISVDHGTGFDLFNKDSVNFSGMFYVLKWAEKLLNTSSTHSFKN